MELNQAWVWKMKKIPETAEKSWNFQKSSQNGMKIEKFLEFQDQNFLKSGISWRKPMPVKVARDSDFKRPSEGIKIYSFKDGGFGNGK